MINKVELHNLVQEAAKLYLVELQNMTESELKDNLQYFAEKCKKIAEGILEQYVFANVNKYTEGPFAISDSDVFGKFCDFTTGYQQQMLNWVAEHSLEVKEETFEFPQKPESEEKCSPISPKTILTGGTIVSIGLFIFTNVWIFLGAELLTIILAKIQSVRIQNNEIRRKEAMEHYAIALENKTNELVNGMINELDKWLDLGEKMSNKILTTFNL